MRLRRIVAKALIAALIASGCEALVSCGSTRAYWGVHNEYEFDDGYHRGHYKPKKHKKHKHKKHHHDHDWYDD